MNYEYVLIFSNTHNALNCEKILKNLNISTLILPTPSNISNSCGISIGIYSNDFDKINKLVLDEKILVKIIYDINNNCVVKSF